MDKSIQKWYLKKSVLIVAILTIGPFALPLIWFNPSFNKRVKVLLSIAIIIFIIILNYALGVILIKSMKILQDSYQSMLKMQ